MGRRHQERAADRAAGRRRPHELPPVGTATSPGHELVLGLQRTVGNASVGRVLQRDEVGDAIESLYEKGEEKAKEWITKLPPTTEGDPLATAETDAIADFESGVQKAKEYFDYAIEAVDWWEKVGGPKPKGLDEAVGGLKKISGGLGRAAKIAGRAKEIVGFAQAVNQFADATASLDLADPESFKAWIKAVKQVQGTAKPLVSWLQEALVEGALAGEMAAAQAFLVVGYVWVMVDLGRQAVEVGERHIRAYHARIEKIVDEAEGRTPRRPPEPVVPGQWYSQAELRRDAAMRERHARAQAIQNYVDEQIRNGIKQFDRQFLGIYMANRPAIRRKIFAALRAEGSTTQVIRSFSDARSGPSRWWDALMPSQGEGGFDPVAGVWVHPTKATVNAEEADFELAEFRRMPRSKRCPWFDQLRRSAQEVHGRPPREHRPCQVRLAWPEGARPVALSAARPCRRQPVEGDRAVGTW